MRVYESEMFARTAEVAAESDRVMALVHSPAGARGVVAFFNGEGTSGEGVAGE
ncbi:hypothetical protein [Kitasatospora sp. NPDC048407]|uniref:hypothetical protein n=1 Tax=Kitasatospora sp. NPDC048407 TaxID=3364051 RepID=UPI003715AD38